MENIKEEIPIVEAKKPPNNVFKILINTSSLFTLYFIIPLLFLVSPLAFINFIPFANYIVPLLLGIAYIFINIKGYKNGHSLNFLLISLFSALSAVLSIMAVVLFCEISMLITCDVYPLLTIPSLISVCFLQIVLWIGALLTKVVVQRKKAFDKSLIISLVIITFLVLLVPIVLDRYISLHKYWDKISDQREVVRTQKSSQDLAEKRRQHAEQMYVEFPDLNQFQIVPYACSDTNAPITFVTDDQRFKLDYDQRYQLWENDYHTHNFHLKENGDTVLSVSHTPDIYDLKSNEQALGVLLSIVKEEHVKFLGYDSEGMNRVIHEITSPSGTLSYYLSFRGSLNTDYDRNMRAIVKVDEHSFQIWEGFTYEEKGNEMFRQILCSLEPYIPN